jgi:hypothetical protein
VSALRWSASIDPLRLTTRAGCPVVVAATA